MTQPPFVLLGSAPKTHRSPAVYEGDEPGSQSIGA